MIRKLKSGFIWEYDEYKKEVCLYIPDTDQNLKVFIPRVKVRSLLCFLNRVAWHREKRKKK